MDYLNSIKKYILSLINYETFKSGNACMIILREYFELYSQFDELYIEGLKIFEKFTEIIKQREFNSLKAFLFFFAYQTKRYSSPAVKELLNQEFITACITEKEEYVDFCMYCFFKGLYLIEKKNYFMASYLYCAAIEMGLNNHSENIFVFNNFSIQMLKTLCFLKHLSDFNVTEYLFKKKLGQFKYYADKMEYDKIDVCFDYLMKQKIDLEYFYNFLKMNKDFDKNNKLIGLRNEAEEMLIFRKIKDIIKMYKKIKLTKLSEYTDIDFNILMKIIKKKCLEGEINVKYDEENDAIEVFDINPGKKEKIKKVQELYKSIIEGNKDYFISLRDKKLTEMHIEGNINIINNYNDDDDDDEY